MMNNVRHLRAVTGSAESGGDYLADLGAYMAEFVRRAPLIEQYLRAVNATAAAEAVVAVKVAASAVAASAGVVPVGTCRSS